MGSLTVGGWVTGHSSIMINNMDLVFSQPRGGVNTIGSKKKRLNLYTCIFSGKHMGKDEHIQMARLLYKMQIYIYIQL